MNEHYKAAYAAYDHTIKDVEEIAARLRVASQKAGKTFDAVLFCSQFDWMLQYSLLECALSDGNLSIDEVLCIKDITKYGDLLAAINNLYNTTFTWEMIYYSNESVVMDVMNAIRRRIDEIRDDFCYFFGLADAALSKDYLDGLTDDISTIMISLVYIDGHAYSSEIANAYSNYIVSVLLQIQREILDRKYS